MADMMTFPDTWEEFEELYHITDTEQIYTNGARLIPSFRVEQWLEHMADRKTESDSEKPNNCEMPCEECGHWEHGAGDHYYCALLEMRQECYFESKDESTLMFANEPKTEPQGDDIIVRSNLEPFRVDEPQTVLNDYSKADDCMECEKFFDCDAPDEVKHASRVSDCAWKKGE